MDTSAATDAGVAARDAIPEVPLVELKPCLSVIVPTLRFAFAAAAPAKDSATLLDQAIAELRADPDLCVEVEGHADAREPGAQGLSEKRARAVVRYFVDHGVDAQRVWFVGYGSARPLAKAGTAINRRVVLRGRRGDECERDGG